MIEGMRGIAALDLLRVFPFAIYSLTSSHIAEDIYRLGSVTLRWRLIPRLYQDFGKMPQNQSVTLSATVAFLHMQFVQPLDYSRNRQKIFPITFSIMVPQIPPLLSFPSLPFKNTSFTVADMKVVAA